MRTAGGRRIDTVLVWAVFCLFAAAALTALSVGSEIYRRTSAATRENAQEQLCLTFLRTKLKGADAAGRVTLGDFMGSPALFIREEIDGANYLTILYCHDGWTRELFAQEGLELAPNDGMKIAQADALALEPAGENLLCIKAGSQRMYIALRGRVGEEP